MVSSTKPTITTLTTMTYCILSIALLSAVLYGIWKRKEYKILNAIFETERDYLCRMNHPWFLLIIEEHHLLSLCARGGTWIKAELEWFDEKCNSIHKESNLVDTSSICQYPLQREGAKEVEVKVFARGWGDKIPDREVGYYQINL